MNEKKLIVVLGNHRSGTSTITRMLKVLGVDLTHSMEMRGVDNPKGHWEDKDIVAINDALLALSGMEWFSLKPLKDEDMSTPAHKALEEEAVNLIVDRLQTYGVYAFKDPRVPRNLRFWRRVFKRCDVPVHYIVTNRNPISISKSLLVRNKFSMQYSYFLSLSHLAPILQYVDFSKALVINYDSLFDNLELQVQRLSKNLGMPVVQKEFEDFRKNFLDPSLMHSEFTLDDLLSDQRCPGLLKRICIYMGELGNHANLADNQIIIRSLSQMAVEYTKNSSSYLLPDDHRRFWFRVKKILLRR